GIIIPRQNLYGLQTTGSSLNIDYYPINFLLLRMEGRLLSSGYNYFLKNGEPVHSNFALLGSVVLFFDKVFL
ncbi:MAG: porin, partial [Sphingobacteriales bacterium]